MSMENRIKRQDELIEALKKEKTRTENKNVSSFIENTNKKNDIGMSFLQLNSMGVVGAG